MRLAEGRATEALSELRGACREWQDLDAPYETAHVRLLLAKAHRELGDVETACWETEEAAAVLGALGANPDLRSLTATMTAPNGLTPREAELLRYLASGASNQEIASHLVISEKTVARHLANIYMKRDVTSRTAAAAFAFKHDLTPQTEPHRAPRIEHLLHPTLRPVDERGLTGAGTVRQIWRGFGQPATDASRLVT